MHFEPEAVPGEIPAQMARLVAITGWNPWRHRLAWLQEQVQANPTMPYFIVERFGLELAFDQVRRHYKQSGRYPWPPETAEQLRFYSVLAMITRCHHRLSSAGKTRLKGMLEDALKSDYGIAPLAFELKIVAHLMMRGFDVIFHDMEEGGGFDYLAKNNDVEIEVECKFVSGDIGRKIHLKKFHQLGTVLLSETANVLDHDCGGCLIHISIPGRLEGNDKQHHEIRHLMSQAIADRTTSAKMNGYEVSITEFLVGDSPFRQLPPEKISLKHVQQFLSDKFGIENKNVLVHFSPSKGVVLVVVESVMKDAVLKGIHRQLKYSASNQFSGDRPGILCCELADLTEEQLLAFRNYEDEGTGLQFMVSDLLARRPQIHTVAFTTPGTVRVQRSTMGTTRRTSAQETGTAYTFRNPDHQMANDPRYDVF